MKNRKLYNQNYIYKSSELRVCVDSVSDGRMSGRVYSMRLSNPIEFSDINDFILKVEDVLDAQNYPQAFQTKRIFKESSSAASPYVSDDSSKLLDEKTVSEVQGKLTTFSVLITSRLNTSWQGFIDKLDGSEKQAFNSDLQFIQLLGDISSKL